MDIENLDVKIIPLALGRYLTRLVPMRLAPQLSERMEVTYLEINVQALNKAVGKYCDLVNRKQINPAEIDVNAYISKLYHEKFRDYEFSDDCIAREKRKIPRTVAPVTQEIKNKSTYILSPVHANVKGGV